ncbi:hypothetical protein M9H77_03142 [Catharanthus roseus]|uniref:Uncharacterized protein n=1 Tax=Catharanthus roseus TaxID=4058 RepID=A0ACC0CAU9_CATRO|nr:hypothetical protein M9H77_03142 [Catharanthus roseus]
MIASHPMVLDRELVRMVILKVEWSDLVTFSAGPNQERANSSSIEGKRSMEGLIEGFSSLHNKIHIIWYQSHLQRLPRNEVRSRGNYVKMDKRFHKRRGNVGRCHDSYDHYKHSYGSKNMYNEHNDSYCYGGYNCKKSSQTLGTTSRPLSYSHLKLPLLCGTFSSYNYVPWKQKLESLFYSYGVREEEKFQLVPKSVSYEVNIWCDCKCKNRRKMGSQPNKTWSLMNKASRNIFGVGKHKGQR